MSVAPVLLKTCSSHGLFHIHMYCQNTEATGDYQGGCKVSTRNLQAGRQSNPIQTKRWKFYNFTPEYFKRLVEGILLTTICTWAASIMANSYGLAPEAGGSPEVTGTGVSDVVIATNG